MRNLPEWAMAFWAIAAAGAVAVPLNAWWTGPELQYGLEDSRDRSGLRRLRAPAANPSDTWRSCPGLKAVVVTNEDRKEHSADPGLAGAGDPVLRAHR